MLAAAATIVGLTLMVAACSNSTEPATASPGSFVGAAISVAVRAIDGTTRPLGVAQGVSIDVTNDGQRSTSVPLTLSLTSPGGASVDVYETSVFAYFGETTMEEVLITPAQWYSDLGTYMVEARDVGGKVVAELQIIVDEPTTIVPRFEDVTVSAGLNVEIPPASCGQFSNGAAWADIDGDADPDLAVTRLGQPSRLFINDGRGQFGEESADRGAAIVDGNGASFADYDNDDDADLLIVGDGRDVLLANDGTGHFRDVSTQAGLAEDDARGMSAAWADFDNDGYLDVFVTNYMHCLGDWSTEEEIISQVSYDFDVLYRNNADGTFTDVTEWLEHDPDDPEDGTTIGAGFTAVWLDYNGDGLMDLYLANDFVGPSPDHNRLWRNDGATADGWQFTDVSLESGAALFMNTMGVGVADVDRDGDMDIALSNVGGNKLLRNTGDGFVDDVEAGIARPTQAAGYASITWGAAFADLNLDGWEDLYLAAGNFQQPPGTPIGEQPNQLFVNGGPDLGFLDVSAATRAADVGDSKGVAVADYDLDGDVDIFVVNQNGAARLFANVTERSSNHWFGVDLVGATSNRDGCGATIRLTIDDRSMDRLVLCGSGGAGSANQDGAHFGLGPTTVIDSVTVSWPSGATQTMRHVEVDQRMTMTEPIE
jgi:enediyne biosynthesis protein E4